MASYVKDLCPVCECNEFRVIGKVNEKDPPVHIPDDSMIVKCSGCRLIYVNPMPYWDDDDYAKLYGESYFLHLKSDEQKKWLHVREHIIPQKRFGRIEEQMRQSNKRMLEIGAGEHAFMSRYLINKGWDATAQEPSKSFADKLRSIEGLKVETRGIKEMDGAGEFSLIFADSVLEHVPDPIVYYQKLASLLVPGGVLYTVSPNEYSMYNFLANMIAKRNGSTPHYIAPYVEPYHLLGFTEKSLNILAEKSNLTLAKYYKADDYMAFHALNSKRRPFIKVPLALLYSLSQGIGMGTNGEALFVKHLPG